MTAKKREKTLADEHEKILADARAAALTAPIAIKRLAAAGPPWNDLYWVTGELAEPTSCLTEHDAKAAAQWRRAVRAERLRCEQPGIGDPTLAA